MLTQGNKGYYLFTLVAQGLYLALSVYHPKEATGGNEQMAKLLGDKFLPESVATRRRSVRKSIRSLRDPVRNFRESTVPGPDVVGMAENTVLDLRDSFTTRDSLVAKLRDMTGSDDESEEGDNDDSEEQSEDEQKRAVNV